MLEPKVFTNFKRIDAEGEHRVNEIKPTDNLIIKGNNLLVLHSLKKRFTGKIKLIYIDPPYNTGNDEFKYNDSFNRSAWLTFMKNRLEVAKDLLRNDGVIFVQISDIEVSRLRLIMDEIFGEENFINKITVKTRSPSGFKTVNLGVFEAAEYILLYGKKKELWKFKTQYVETEYDANYSYIILNRSESPDKWEFGKIDEIISKKLGHKNVGEAKKALGKKTFLEKKAEFALENAEKVFRFTEINRDAGKDTLDAKKQSLKKKDKVIVVKRAAFYDRYVLNGKEIAFYSKKVKEIDGEKKPTTLLSNIWTDIPWEGIASEGGVRLKKGKKPEKLLRRIIDMSTKKNDLVLDFFLGSGTTCAVAHKMSRQYIGVEQLEYGENDSIIRLRNVINRDSTGISKVVGWKGGGYFIYCELKELNETFIQKVMEAKETKELLRIWEEMKQNGFLSYRVDENLFDENIQQFETLSAKEQKRILVECLEANDLYVNYSEIEDKQYNLSGEDIELNKRFYAGL